jgi:hypothetical protein
MKARKSKLQHMVRDAGFLPDGNLIEFASMVLEECCKLLDSDQAEIIKKHFGLNDD